MTATAGDEGRILVTRQDVAWLAGRDLSDIVANNRAFDAVWYAARNADSIPDGMTAERHFCMTAPFGVPPANPLPRGEDDAKAILATLKEPKRLSYCIPVLDRLSDLQATLTANLTSNRRFQDQIEFIVSVLSPDDPALEWVRCRFAEDLDSGYLRLIQPMTLIRWHFGRAKNSFRGRLRGTFYSSLDADNHLDPDEVSQTLDIMDKGHPAVLIHHFSGTWGDGTSGRITVPRSVYEIIGYDERFLWRQFDEMDLLISAIRRLPGIHLYRRDTENHLFSAPEAATFAEDLHFNLHLGAVGATSRAMNAKATDYVASSPELQAMTRFNTFSSFEKNEASGERREMYRDLARAAGFSYLDAAPAETIATLMRPMGDTAPPRAEADLALFGCLKNDHRFLPAFYKHYRDRGVDRFFLIDDGSDIPGPQAFSAPGVHWFQPNFGWYGTSKVLWMKALMQTYLRPGAWALMVDADEFVDLPEGLSSFADLGVLLAEQGAFYADGLLIDMVPGPGCKPDKADFVTSFDHFLMRPGPVDTGYVDAVSWGFGERPDISWAVDLRHHLLGTLDSLRKLPFVRPTKEMRFNQGFHDLTLHDDGTTSWRAPPMPLGPAILPIRHYKLTKLSQSGTSGPGKTVQAEQDLAGYFFRTRQNILKMIESDIVDHLAQVPPGLLRRYGPQSISDLLAGKLT
ncbi:glycosyltransferase family 2 protein [Aliigemmobacter aestuarii]|uniref:Glycosyltransferase family 2 protein n=1 Tax=Aliigemmobacter aestuarii TaxID=1445661 RepID=A0A4S3MIK5_9RHOB|nr:glycosyltransferase family 2 protein [Gemmobacter aestuarii]THD80840.1 glycosyltransferase family 2 protein [Gemmobacter aestuarii]